MNDIAVTDSAQLVTNYVHRELQNFFGNDVVHSEWNPKRGSTYVAVYAKVWGMNVRMDFDYKPVEGDIVNIVTDIRNRGGEDLRDLWVAGPDRNAMYELMHGGGSNG
jgi:hypothetical protein